MPTKMGGSPEPTYSQIQSAISIFIIAFAAVVAGAGTGTGTEIAASSNPNPNPNMPVFPRSNLEFGFGEAQPEEPEPEPGDFKLQLQLHNILPAPVYSFDVDRDDEELNTLPPGLTKKMNNANNEVIKTDADYSDADAATDPQPQRQIQSSSSPLEQENEDKRKSIDENEVGKSNYEEQSKYKSTKVKSKPQKIKAEVTIPGVLGENATISSDTETEPETQSSTNTEINTKASGVQKNTNSSLNSVLKSSSSPSFKPILRKYLTTASPTSGKLFPTSTGTPTGWPEVTEVKINDFDSSDLKIEPSATIDDANDTYTDTDTDTANIFDITEIHDSIYQSHFHPQGKVNTSMNINNYNNNSSGGYYNNNNNATFNMNNGLWAGALPGSDEGGDLPMYLRVTAFIFLLIIFAVGTIGNTMVIIVIHCSRDMRTSTNIFLVNLSVADLLVLLICTPTCIMEVYYDPEIWLLGSAMCKLVPLLEVTVAHASVLTILAISFERYYAICCPLKANYVCTKTRAISICVSTWIAAGVITSPMYLMINYYTDKNNKPHCEVGAGTLWADVYFISSIVIFFLLPLLILLITYGLIAQNLTTDRSRLKHNYTRQNHRARQQVVLMLGTVVFTFFLCLLPFRLLTMFILISDHNPFTNEVYYNIEYFCRIMLYTNSALNPILYNIMSSKFRNGFLLLCSRRRRRLSRFQRQGTFHTLTTTSSTSTTSNLPNNFIHSTATAIPITAEATKDRNRLRRLGLCRGGRCVCVCGYSCGCTCACSTCCQNSNMTGHFWTGKILGNSAHSHHDLMNKNKNLDLDLDRYSYSFTNVNLNTAASPNKYNQFHNNCKKCCEFETNKSRLGAKWLHKHLTLSPGGTTTATGESSALILSQSQSPGGGDSGGDHRHSPCCHNGNGNNGGNNGGKCHCHFSCSSSRAFSRGISSENNLIDKCFSLNCQICQRRRKGHILAAVQEDQNRRAKTANGMDGNGGKLTIKMAMKSNYYSCSFSSFSNTNTMETIL